MQYRVRKEVKVRKQETIEKVRCFRYWKIRHYKQEYPNIKVKRKRRRKEEMAHVARPQKVQQERRPACSTQEKTQEYCNKWSILPKGTLLLKRGWIIEETVVMYIDCRECKGKGIQTHKNQEQRFLLERQIKNIQCGLCQEVWNWREGKARKEEITRVQYVEYRRKNAIVRKVSE